MSVASVEFAQRLQSPQRSGWWNDCGVRSEPERLARTARFLAAAYNADWDLVETSRQLVETRLLLEADGLAGASEGVRHVATASSAEPAENLCNDGVGHYKRIYPTLLWLCCQASRSVATWYCGSSETLISTRSPALFSRPWHSWLRWVRCRRLPQPSYFSASQLMASSPDWS